MADEMTTQEYRSFEVCGESAASGDMTMRSWYMPKASADRLAALVDDVHFSTRLPKHLIMGALVKVADRYRAEVEAEAQAAGRQRLERKELRIWADQLDALTKLRGALNQQRGERASGSPRTRSSAWPSTCSSPTRASCAGLPRTSSGSPLPRNSRSACRRRNWYRPPFR